MSAEAAAALPAAPMSVESALWIFRGVEAIALLFMGYILFELGLALYKKVKDGKLSLTKAQLMLGIPATVFAFVPVVIMVMFIRLEPLGPGLPFDTGSPGTVFGLFNYFALGFVLEAVTLAAFWYKTREFEKPAAK